MAQPTGSDLFVNVPLTNLSTAYIQDTDTFIADKVFPPVPVPLQGGVYFRYKQEDWFRNDARERAPATESAGSGWNVDTDSYLAKVIAIHKDVADQDRANAMQPLDLDRDATTFVTEQMLIRKEVDWGKKYFAAGVWGTTDQTGAASAPSANQFLRWDNANSLPAVDVETQQMQMAEMTGKTPNVLVLGPRTFAALKNNPSILDRIKYTERGVITTDLLAQVFGVDRVLVPMGTLNTAMEGQTGAYSFIYGKGALLAYAAPNPGIYQVSAGYTFWWAGYSGVGGMGTRIKRFRMENIASDRVEGEVTYDQKLVSPNLGVFFAQAVT